MFEAMRSKEVFTKHCDSVLQKIGKLRSLEADLRKNYEMDATVTKSLNYIIVPRLVTEMFLRIIMIKYSEGWYLYSSFAKNMQGYKDIHLSHTNLNNPLKFILLTQLRSCKTLQTDMAKLDEQHNTLSDIMAEGERDDFNDTSFGCTSKRDFWISLQTWANIFISNSKMTSTEFRFMNMPFWNCDFSRLHVLRWRVKMEKKMKDSTFVCTPQVAWCLFLFLWSNYLMANMFDLNQCRKWFPNKLSKFKNAKTYHLSP